MPAQNETQYRRILLKLSGEALQGDQDGGIQPVILDRLATDIVGLVKAGVQVGVVIGGGNIFRGAELAARGMDKVTGDHMGMLATVMNALAMQDALARLGQPASTLSAIRMEPVCQYFDRHAAIERLERGEVVMFAAGTGNPGFTTDSAASLRAIEIGADLMIKATKVDGVYSADPVKDPTAKLYSELRYDQVIEEQLGVMDLTAVVLCRDHQLPLRVMNIFEADALQRVIRGESLGTRVSAGD